MNLCMLLILLAADPVQVAQSPAQTVLHDGGRVVVLQRLHPAPPRTLTGSLFSLTGAGALVLLDAGLVLLDAHGNAPRPVPTPSAHPLPVALPYLDLPGFFTLSDLWYLRDDGWQSVPFPRWFDYVPPQPVPGAATGFAPEWPHVFSRGAQIHLYQGKDGRLVTRDIASGRITRHDRDPKCVPLPVGGDLFWIDAPKKGRIGLVADTAEAAWLDTLAVDDLSRHSPALPTAEGLWVLTFDEGLRAGLRSWEQGTVPITAHLITRHGTKLVAAHRKLGDLPVRFSLETRAGGSPKLEVTPLFLAVPLPNRRLVLASGDQLTLEGIQGTQARLPLQVPVPQISAMVPADGGMMLWDGTRPVLHTWRKQP